MNRSLRLLFFFGLVLGPIAIYMTTLAWPEPIATHFAGDGLADGWMSRNGYQIFMLAFSLGLPLILWAPITYLPKIWPQALNLPNKEKLLQTHSIRETFGILDTFGLRLGLLAEILVLAIHYCVWEANQHQPARLSMSLFLPILVSGLVGITGLSLAFYHRFQKI